MVLMKELGAVFAKARQNKNLTQADLIEKGISASLLSNLERGVHKLSAENFIRLMNKLNLTYDEVILLSDSDYHQKRLQLERSFSEAAKHRNKKKLKSVERLSEEMFNEFHDIFFDHLRLMARAWLEVMDCNNEHSAAQQILNPIKNYLEQVKIWGFYEMRLASQCLNMFTIEEALTLGTKLLKVMADNSDFYRNQTFSAVLLSNLTIYALDHDRSFEAISYAQQSISLASINRDATRSIQGEILLQLAYYKEENNFYREKKLKHFLGVLESLGWESEYENIKEYIQKHGIDI